MSSNESEFDKLLKEAREWEARDRARHKSFVGDEDGDARPLTVAPPAARVTIEGLAKTVAADVRPNPAKKATLQERVQPINVALKAAMKQGPGQAQVQAKRGKRGAGWGWIWVLVLLYFLFKRFWH